MAGPANFLDGDDSALEETLRIVKDGIEDNLQHYFGGGGSSADAAGSSGNVVQAPPRDYKVVQPRPGFCIKTFKVNTNEKYFINVCVTEDIPAPQDLTEEQLTEVLESEEPGSFRVPMSIADPRVTKDNSNNPVDVCDIAINPQFYDKIKSSLLFKEFFITIIAEALSDKYNVQVKLDRCIILNNRKVMGSLVSHRVRNTDVAKVLDNRDIKFGGGKAGGPLVQEIDADELQNLKQKQEKAKGEIQTKVTNVKKQISIASSNEPQYKLRARVRGEQVTEIKAEFYLPKCVTMREMTLDVGEDRILLESMKHGYLFDKFVNYRLDQERAVAIFHKTLKMLHVRIPVIA